MAAKSTSGLPVIGTLDIAVFIEIVACFNASQSWYAESDYHK
ncbi:hypothetical protein AB0758_45705 [Tolypothrix bouteillei VB521301_2]